MTDQEIAEKIKALLERNRVGWRYGDSTVWPDSAYVDARIDDRRVRVEVDVLNLYDSVSATRKTGKQKSRPLEPHGVRVFVAPCIQGSVTNRNLALSLEKCPEDLFKLFVEILKDNQAYYVRIQEAKCLARKKKDEQKALLDLKHARDELSKCIGSKIETTGLTEDVNYTKSIVRKVLTSKFLNWDECTVLSGHGDIKSTMNAVIAAPGVTYGKVAAVKLEKSSLGDMVTLRVECSDPGVVSIYSCLYREYAVAKVTLPDNDPLVNQFRNKFKALNVPYTERKKQEEEARRKAEEDRLQKVRNELVMFIDNAIAREPERLTDELLDPLPKGLYD